MPAVPPCYNTSQFINPLHQHTAEQTPVSVYMSRHQQIGLLRSGLFYSFLHTISLPFGLYAIVSNIIMFFSFVNRQDFLTLHSILIYFSVDMPALSFSSDVLQHLLSVRLRLLPLLPLSPWGGRQPAPYY